MGASSPPIGQPRGLEPVPSTSSTQPSAARVVSIKSSQADFLATNSHARFPQTPFSDTAPFSPADCIGEECLCLGKIRAHRQELV